MLPAHLREMLDTGYSFIVEYLPFNFFSDLTLPFSALSNYLLLVTWTGQISFVICSEALKWILLLKALRRRWVWEMVIAEGHS